MQRSACSVAVGNPLRHLEPRQITNLIDQKNVAKRQVSQSKNRSEALYEQMFTEAYTMLLAGLAIISVPALRWDRPMFSNYSRHFLSPSHSDEKIQGLTKLS